MRKYAFLMTVVSVLFFSLSTVFAQDEEKKEEKGFKDKWDSKVSLGFSAYTGNVEQTDLRGAFGLTRKDEVLESSIYFKNVFSKATTVLNREYDGGIAFDYKPQSKVSPFMVLSAYNNKFKGYDLRLSAMAGAKYTFLKTETGKYSISGAVLFEQEDYTPYDVTNEDGTVEEKDNPTQELKRISIRPKFKQKIGKNTTINGIAFYKANLEDFSEDYQFEADLSISNKINEIMSFAFTYEFDYNNKPVGDKKTTDQAFIASLVFAF